MLRDRLPKPISTRTERTDRSAANLQMNNTFVTIWSTTNEVDGIWKISNLCSLLCHFTRIFMNKAIAIMTCYWLAVICDFGIKFQC